MQAPYNKNLNDILDLRDKRSNRLMTELMVGDKNSHVVKGIGDGEYLKLTRIGAQDITHPRKRRKHRYTLIKRLNKAFALLLNL